MSTPLKFPGFRRSVDRLAMTLRAFTLIATWCCLLAAVTGADDGRPIDSRLEFGRAAMDLRRLPPTTDRDASQDSADIAAARPVSFASPGPPQTGAGDEYETSLYLGYDRGFVVGANQAMGNDPSTIDFLMRVNSWSQLRQTHFDSDGPNLDQNTFSFERLRLSFGGHVLSPDLQYFFQFDGNSDRSTDTIFLDYFATYDVGHGVFCSEKGQFGLKFGKWKVPFSRSREESGRLLQFSDRASANVFFDLNRSIGVGISSSMDPLHLARPNDGRYEFEAAVFNGFKTGSVTTNRGNELDRNFGCSARAHRDFFSDFGNDGEPDLIWHCEPALRTGTGLAYTRIDAVGTTEFSRQRAVDSGVTLASLLPPSVTAYDLWLFTMDAHFKYQGLSVIAEYYWRYITEFKGAAVPSLYDDGFVLQTGYFVIPEKLELLARWSRIAGYSGTLGLFRESSDELAAGFVWYFRGPNAKLTFDATHVNGVPVSGSRVDFLPGDVGWMFRTQFQLAF